jgi:hypothetical protein
MKRFLLLAYLITITNPYENLCYDCITVYTYEKGYRKVDITVHELDNTYYESNEHTEENSDYTESEYLTPKEEAFLRYLIFSQ